MVLNKNLHKEALKTFRYIQKIMTPGPRPYLEETQQLLDRGVAFGGLRDEIYVQICKVRLIFYLNFQKKPIELTLRFDK